MGVANSVGFTGSQKGMTKHQFTTFREILSRLSFGEFHHGDCIGADADAHNFVDAVRNIRTLDEPWILIARHPPDIDTKRAFCPGADKNYPAKPYLERNKDIVSFSHFLIACPGESNEELRSGTWSTIRYARKLGRTVFIIDPKGVLTVEVPR